MCFLVPLAGLPRLLHVVRHSADRLVAPPPVRSSIYRELTVLSPAAGCMLLLLGPAWRRALFFSLSCIRVVVDNDRPRAPPVAFRHLTAQLCNGKADQLVRRRRRRRRQGVQQQGKQAPPAAG